MAHTSAVKLNELFIKVYGQNWNAENTKILEQGPGGLTLYKDAYTSKGCEYFSYELEDGKEILSLPYEDNTFDVVFSNSVFEHDSMFWLSFNEFMRVLKPNGLFFLTAPSNGIYHTFPLDCWRFYPDAGKGLIKWAHHSGFKKAALIESFTADKYNDIWCDYVSVFIKDQDHMEQYPKRLSFNVDWTPLTNVYVHDFPDLLNRMVQPQDQRPASAEQYIKPLHTLPELRI
jgi:SAM-dependent methyltransferase